MIVVALALGLALFAIAQGVNIVAAGVFAMVFGTLCASVLADSVRRPMEELDDVARALVSGTLTRRPSLAPYDESGSLADSLRRLADQLSSQRQ